MGKNWTRRSSNHNNEKEMEMDWPYLTKVERKNTTRMAVTWTSQGNRKQGRPKQSWRRTVVMREVVNIGNTWGEAEKIAENRGWWIAMVETMCLTRGKEI